MTADQTRPAGGDHTLTEAEREALCKVIGYNSYATRTFAEVERILAARADKAAAALARVEAERDDWREARKVAADAVDRFRDVLSECLGHPDENPGDDVLVAEVRAHFGKSSPEPTRWRDFLTGAEAIRDQINAAALDADPAPTSEEGER